MTFSDLVDYFGAHTVFPIKIEDVRSWCLQYTHQDNIEFHEVDINPDVSFGQIYQFTRHSAVYGNPEFHSYITVGKLGEKPKLSMCEQRFVLCKEMIHLTDRKNTRTASLAQIEILTRELAEGISANAGLRDSATYTDLLTEYKTMAVLAPIDAVNKLRPKYEDGRLTDMDIAQFFKIPVVYIPKLMSQTYVQIYDDLLYE